ncbi:MULTISPECIES: TetR/AcrR family transcriptional regulator [unclassified Diaminobutyricimonas]|uniref:TetR/AcrR family transcriptional regulator n=1 Tax=unclassified Diaminobutyricimonas TaxID=2643261 RepID=UPI0012F4DC55|nr:MULTISPECIES: TetR/AcrR family transcriptional regulator [unclassified Diaminobutyricimonas]
MSPAAAPRTARGSATRQKILDAAEQVFAEVGYTEASIVRITEQAGVGQGTFYLYFDSKLQVFEELVEDLNRRVRHAMSEAASQATNRLEAERLGFKGFFEFTAKHPALYRVVREAEFVSPRALRSHYTKIVEGYIEGLSKAHDAGEITADPTVAAWMLMGIGEMIGMRWVLWGARTETDDASTSLTGDTELVPQHVFDEMMRFIRSGLGGAPISDQEDS